MNQENRKNSAPGATERSKIDWDLVLRRLKTFVLGEKELGKAERLVENENVWRKLPPDKAIEWVEVAQAMGKHELSLRIIEWVLKEHPHYLPAWEAKTKLLEFLIARSSDASPAADDFNLEAYFDSPARDGISKPFDEFRTFASYVANYMEIFKGREDCFARQWVDRERGVQGYTPVRRPLSEQDVVDHLRCKHTYGIYLLHHDNTVSLGVIDVDCRSDFLKGKISQEDRKLFKQENAYLLRRLPETAASRGIPCFVEFSGGKGYHFWFSFSEPVPASIVRKVLIPIAESFSRDLRCFKLEVFPKQDRATGKGFGNLVKLPLGVHRVTGKQSFFIGEKDRSLNAQLAWLLKVPRIPPGSIESCALAAAREITVHPKDEKWAEAYPELAALSSRCNVLGQLIHDCRTGRSITVREEKVLLGTITFLPRGRLLLHYLLKHLPDYNPHLLDYKMSRVRGTPLGCRTIHRLLDVVGDFCIFENSSDYSHPLLHVPQWQEEGKDRSPVCARVTNLQDALNFLRTAILAVERFLPKQEDSER